MSDLKIPRNPLVRIDNARRKITYLQLQRTRPIAGSGRRLRKLGNLLEGDTLGPEAKKRLRMGIETLRKIEKMIQEGADSATISFEEDEALGNMMSVSEILEASTDPYTRALETRRRIEAHIYNDVARCLEDYIRETGSREPISSILPKIGDRVIKKSQRMGIVSWFFWEMTHLRISERDEADRLYGVRMYTLLCLQCRIDPRSHTFPAHQLERPGFFRDLDNIGDIMAENEAKVMGHLAKNLGRD